MGDGAAWGCNEAGQCRGDRNRLTTQVSMHPMPLSIARCHGDRFLTLSLRPLLQHVRPLPNDQSDLGRDLRRAASAFAFALFRRSVAA